MFGVSNESLTGILTYRDALHSSSSLGVRDDPEYRYGSRARPRARQSLYTPKQKSRPEISEKVQNCSFYVGAQFIESDDNGFDKSNPYKRK